MAVVANTFAAKFNYLDLGSRLFPQKVIGTKLWRGVECLCVMCGLNLPPFDFGYLLWQQATWCSGTDHRINKDIILQSALLLKAIIIQDLKITQRDSGFPGRVICFIGFQSFKVVVVTQKNRSKTFAKEALCTDPTIRTDNRR